MGRFVDAHQLGRAAAVLHAAHEQVLRLVEHPDVTSGLKQQHRRDNIGARGRVEHRAAELERLAHPLECGAIGLVFNGFATQAMVPAFARLAGILVQAHVDRGIGIEINLPEHTFAPETDAAEHTGQRTREPQRHAGLRGDHRRGEHRLVEQGGILLQYGRADAAAHRMAEQVQRLTVGIPLADA